MVLHLPFLASNWNVKMLVLEERGKQEYPEKTSQNKRGNQQQAQPTYIQLFQEWFSEKVHATTPKGLVGGFDFTVFQKKFKQWHKWPRT